MAALYLGGYIWASEHHSVSVSVNLNPKTEERGFRV
jgi:hypothetical protein